MAENSSCKYCASSDYGDREYGLHRLSNSHIKKVRMDLLQCEFSGVCFVCKHGLQDLKDVENHVQSETHRIKLKAGPLSSLYAVTNNCTCELCAVSFHNRTALEVHRLMPTHTKAERAYHYPKLNELLKQVSGLPGEELALNVTSLCRICDVQLHSLEAYIMHLFTTAHISRLRYSECLVCSKAFVHAENREAHLVSSKHVLALQKLSTGVCKPANLLIKGGYPCMVCMIWCSSWPCLELHLLYTHHADAFKCQSKKNHSILIAKMNFILPAINADEVDAGSICDVSHVRRWKEWRESVLKEHAWCHACGTSLPNLDMVNEHLKMHDTGKCPSTLLKKHAAHEGLECKSPHEMFSCSLCAISFRSAFMLLAHEACIGHYCRLASSLASTHFLCCTNCGVMVEMNEQNLNASASNASEKRCTEEACIDAEDCNGKGGSKLDVSSSYRRQLKEERSPVHQCKANGDVTPFPLFDADRVKMEKDADIPQAKLHPHTPEVAEKTEEARCDGKSGACSDIEGELHSGACVVLQDADVKIPVVTAAALLPVGALQHSMQSMMSVVTEALLKSLQEYMQNIPAKRKLETRPETSDQSGKIKKLCLEQKALNLPMRTQTFAMHMDSEQENPVKRSALHIYEAMEKAELTASDDKSLWPTNAFLTGSASPLPNALPDSSTWLRVQHGEDMLAKGKQVSIAPHGVDDVCKLADKLVDIKTCSEQSAKASQCRDSEKLDVHHTLQTCTLMDMHTHDNEIENTMQEGLGFKTKEPPEMITELDIPPPCNIKSEKHIVDDDNDSLNVPNNFKDADLWWVLSDSEDGEISH